MSESTLDGGAIWYSACNEDGASEIAALAPAGKRILTITASGSRAFDLLLADPAAVLAIDQNPAQTALAELYRAAYCHLDYPAFAALCGLRPSERREETVRALLPHLPEPARAFWHANGALARGGLLYCGRWEGFLRAFRQWAGRRRQALADRLLACPDLEAQHLLWTREWDDWRWRTLLRLLALRPLWKWVLKEPGIAHIPRDFSIDGYARARFDHAARNLPFRQLPFAWLLFAGEYDPACVPPYLTEAGHAAIRARAHCVRFVTASLMDTLVASEAEAFDGASLSDYSSYSDSAEQGAVWAQLRRVMAPGGRVCERKFFNKTGQQWPEMAGFMRDTRCEAALDAGDGAWFYTFVVATRGEAA